MRQVWEDLLFAHWPCPVSALRRLIPAALDIESFDGSGWVGVVPFRMSGVKLRAMPRVPGAHAFPELNVRTYVRHGDKPGVWFFSLDAGSRLAVSAARASFHLPYFRADMNIVRDGDVVRYSATRIQPGARPASFDARYGPSGPVTPAAAGSLEHFLVERYCLYAANARGRLWRGDIHHRPWPLQPAHARISHNTMAEAAGIALPLLPPRLHFARTLDVRVWAPTRVT